MTGASNVQMDEHIADISAFIDAKLGGGAGPPWPRRAPAAAPRATRADARTPQAPVLVGHSFGGMYCQKVAASPLSY